MKKNKLMIKQIDYKRDSRGGIYLVKPSQYVTNGSNIFKLGKSRNPRKRIKSYGQGTIIFKIVMVNDCDSAEKDLIELFNQHFCLIKGKEYFSGKIGCMIDVIDKYVGNKNKQMDTN